MTCCPGHSLRDVRTPEASKLSQSIATKLANFFASYRIRLLRGIRPLTPMGLNHRLRRISVLPREVSASLGAVPSRCPATGSDGSGEVSRGHSRSPTPWRGWLKGRILKQGAV